MKRLFPVILLLCASWLARAAPPNFLLIIADDCTYRDLGVYGGQAKTPHLEKLAGQGMKLTRCFQAASMCSPTRHALYTGLYPVKSGAYPNHTMAYDWVKSIAHYLQATGYTTHLSGKTHIHPRSVFPFKYSARAGDGNPDPAEFATTFSAASKPRSPSYSSPPRTNLMDLGTRATPRSIRPSR
jgi:N-sulfoglucosamine sulfohydrolase